VVIEVVPSVNDIYTLPITSQSDFSIVETPESQETATVFYRELYKTQLLNHITVGICRQNKQRRLSSFVNIIEAEKSGFTFHDFVSVVTDKDSKRVPGTLHGYTETIALLSKSDDINIPATEWFNPEQKQATNHWMTEAHAKEKPVVSTGKNFTFEVLDLISSLSSPLINRRISIFGIVSFNYLVYAKLRNYAVYAVTSDLLSAKKALTAYESPKNK
jgi:hypothetical protein